MYVCHYVTLRNVMSTVVNSHLERRKKLATLHKSTIAVSPDPLPLSEGVASETRYRREKNPVLSFW